MKPGPILKPHGTPNSGKHAIESYSYAKKPNYAEKACSISTCLNPGILVSIKYYEKESAKGIDR